MGVLPEMPVNAPTLPRTRAGWLQWYRVERACTMDDIRILEVAYGKDYRAILGLRLKLARIEGILASLEEYGTLYLTWIMGPVCV